MVVRENSNSNNKRGKGSPTRKEEGKEDTQKGEEAHERGSQEKAQRKKSRQRKTPSKSRKLMNSAISKNPKNEKKFKG